MHDPEGSTWGQVSLKLARALNRDPRITDASRRIVFVMLARARGPDDAMARQAWPSIDSLVDDTGLSRWSVQDATKALVSCGYLIDVDGRLNPAALARKTKTYRINDNPPPIPDDQAFRKTGRKPERDANGRPLRKRDIRPATDGVEAHDPATQMRNQFPTGTEPVLSHATSVEQRTLASVAERTPASVAQRTHPPSLDGPNTEDNTEARTQNPNTEGSRAEGGALAAACRFAAFLDAYPDHVGRDGERTLAAWKVAAARQDPEYLIVAARYWAAFTSQHGFKVSQVMHPADWLSRRKYRDRYPSVAWEQVTGTNDPECPRKATCA